MLYRFAAVLALAFLAVPAHAQALPLSTNWAKVGADAEARSLPVVVVVTGAECGHCTRMHREFLSDPAIHTLLMEQAVTRELQRETGGKITDFDGERLRARLFLARYDIFATPTVLFLDSQGGSLAPPVVGYNDAEAYLQIFTSRLKQAQVALSANNVEPHRALASVAR